MKLLVITPTLGLSPWMAETVASVAAHGGGARHVLVAPAAVADSLAARFPSVQMETDPGGGMYAAINAGLAAAGHWEAFSYLNDDDVLLPDFAANVRAVEAMGVRAAGIGYGGVRLISGDGRRMGAIPISPAPALNRLLYAQRLEPVYQHGTVVTRAVIDRIGAFDAGLRFCGDSEFLARACVRGVPFVRATGRETAAFRLRAGQLTKNRAAMLAERNRVDEKLGLLAPKPAGALRWARWRFRIANLSVYTERIRRHGFVTFDTLLERGG